MQSRWSQTEHADDRDMKIAGRDDAPKRTDAGEKEAASYERHRDNGNLRRAMRLGRRMAEELVRPDSDATSRRACL